MFLIGMVATLGLASAPAATVYAMAPGVSVKLSSAAQVSSERLELAWAREQMIHDRLGFMFDHADQRIALTQQLIDKAKANGKDVAAIQAALDALAGAVERARPGFEGMQGTFASHPGFDAGGKVIDPTVAAQTVRNLDAQLRATRSVLAEPMMGLRDAVAAFRQTNRPLTTPSSTPSQ
jgi:hypothetical protein